MSRRRLPPEAFLLLGDCVSTQSVNELHFSHVSSPGAKGSFGGTPPGFAVRSLGCVQATETSVSHLENVNIKATRLVRLFSELNYRQKSCVQSVFGPGSEPLLTRSS